ncbi:MAG: TldD/PmbA family protein [Firmicutes bacterium]|nr:TldD/PmbA family protein [Bacillota bacterium]
MGRNKYAHQFLRRLGVKEKIEAVLSLLEKIGVDYADIRVHDIREESFSTEDCRLLEMTAKRARGYGIRVFLEGSPGFAASQDFEKMELTARQALEIARAGRLARQQPVKLAPRPAAIDSYRTPIEIDPFAVSKGEKIDLLLAAEAEMRREEPGLFKTSGTLDFRCEEKVFTDTEGSYILQKLYQSGGGIKAFAAGEGDRQVRSYPASFKGNFATAGYEFIKEMALVENGARIAREAVSLLGAEECPSGVFDLVIDSSQMMLQIHESVGHAIELDRVLGFEAGYAGTSFLKPGMEGFQYGSEHVNIVADATTPGGLGTFGYDDEGVPAQCIPIVTKGRFENFINCRDSAARLDGLSSGAARADGWNRIPIVRMTNINLLPGEMELEELFAGIEYGFYLCTNKSWSIDDKRLNFQFACEIAHEIRDGRLTGRVFKNPIYTGITPQFWGSCDGVAGEKYWQVYGTPNCGKGEPMQIGRVAHGCSPARFRNVKVGVADVV